MKRMSGHVWTVILKYNFSESATVGYAIFDRVQNLWSNDKAYFMVFNYSVRGLRIRAETEHECLSVLATVWFLRTNSWLWFPARQEGQFGESSSFWFDLFESASEKKKLQFRVAITIVCLYLKDWCAILGFGSLGVRFWIFFCPNILATPKKINK